jgi:TrmH family RNA methyltransferase
VLLLEDIQDPGNVGALVRTAAAFYFDGIVLSGECADPFSPKAVQASAGAVLSVWIRRSQHYRAMAQRLREQGFTLIATHTHGDAGQVFTKKKKICVALGNEGNGLSGHVMGIADAVFAIPCNTDAVESLNVAAAGAICLYLSGGSS